MSSTTFVPGMCVIHPLKAVAPGQKFRCAECAGISETSVAKETIKFCVNHKAIEAVAGSHFCADCKAWVEKKRAEIETVRTEAAKKAAVEKTGNPNATGKRGAIGDPLKRAEKEEEKERRAEKRIENRAIREAEKTEKAESRAEKEARILAFKAAEDQAMLCKSEQVPVLVLMRAADPKTILDQVAKLGRHFLRSGKIHFLPRFLRNRKDAIRAEHPDLLIGPLAKDLDPAPFAFWIPLDPKGGNKSDLPWFREKIEIKQLIGEKYLVVREIPAECPERCDPSIWNEVKDMSGAEVLDLRNYPDVLAEVKDTIKADLDRSIEWSDLLRENAETRNGLCFAKTGERQEEYFDLIAASPENMKREDPPAEIKAVVKETAADFSKMPVESILNGRKFVVEFS